MTSPVPAVQAFGIVVDSKSVDLFAALCFICAFECRVAGGAVHCRNGRRDQAGYKL